MRTMHEPISPINESMTRMLRQFGAKFSSWKKIYSICQFILEDDVSLMNLRSSLYSSSKRNSCNPLWRSFALCSRRAHVIVSYPIGNVYEASRGHRQQINVIFLNNKNHAVSGRQSSLISSRLYSGTLLTRFLQMLLLP